MAENKKSFVAYCDWGAIFDELSDAEAGKLAKHLFDYVRDKNPKPDKITKLTFIQIQQTLKRDLKKYEEYVERQRINGQKGGRPEKPKKPKPYLANPLEPKKGDSVNDTVNVNDKDINIDSNEYELSKLLFDLIKKRNPNHKQPDLKSWAKHIDLMIRIDKRTIDEIRGCINWCQQDPFWQNNILSTAKLRKQFDTLYLKAKGSKDGISASITEDKLRRIAESIANDDRLK
jgi:hypothetical protein